MSLVLYSNRLSPGVRAVLMTAKELDVTFQEKHIDFAAGDHLKPELMNVNPQHTVPTLVDDGVGIWDSHAINAYLVRKYGKDDKLYPKDFVKRAIVDQRLHFDSGSCFSILYQIMKPMWMGVRYTIPGELIENTKISYGFLEKFLENKLWVAGDEVTIADFSLLATITSLNILVPIDPATHPNIIAWLKRAETKPFYVANAGLDEYRKVVADFLAKGK